MTAAERIIDLRDGRTVRAYDSGPVRVGGPTIVWQHGSPHTGVPLPPLLEAAAARGIRLLTYARPSYGGSTPRPGRDVAAAAPDVAQVADAYGVDTFATMGASGGAPHALACAALLPDRVTAVACLAGLSPYTGDDDWFAGMVSDGALRSAAEGRAARERYAASDQFDPAVFTAADWAALAGPWASLGADAELAAVDGLDGLVDDDVAFTAPWGFDLAMVSAPTLLVHGGEDRMVPPAHTERLAGALPRAEVWRRPDDGHVSVLAACPAAMDWLVARS